MTLINFDIFITVKSVQALFEKDGSEIDHVKGGSKMPYTELIKLYYSKPEQYEDAYQKRFNSPYAQHIGFMVGQSPAFFVVTPEIQSRMIAIQRIDKKIVLVCGGLPGVALAQFSKRCLIDEIVLTNNIEGVHSTRREIDGILTNLGKQDKHARFKGLVQKYHMLQMEEEIPLRTCGDIRQVYDDLTLREVVEDCPENMPDGKVFRKGSVSVQSATQKEIHRGLFPESKIISAMEDALAYLNDDSVELLYRISVFHYLLGYIHPFYDGNGRLNRFISSYLLMKELQPILSFRLSYTIKENIREYYDAFKTCNHPQERGDLTPFLHMFLKVVQESAEQLLIALTKRAGLLDHYAGSIEKLPCAGDAVFYKLYHYLIQAELFSEHGISTQELLTYLNLSRATLRKKLDMIQQAGLLKTEPYKRGKCYGIALDKIDALTGGPGAEGARKK